jgi:hypothetical protein
MDDQFRNRLRRYDIEAPLRPRPNAPRPIARPQSPQQSAMPTTAPSAQSAHHPAPTRPAQSLQSAWAAPTRPTHQHQAASAKAVKSKKEKKAKRRRKAGRGRRVVLVLFLLILLAGAAGGAFWFGVRPRLHKPAGTGTIGTSGSAPAENQAATPSKMIRLVAVGDSITYSSINQAAQKGGDYDYSVMMAAIKPLLSKAGVRICSQTVPAGGAAGGGVSGPPTFNASPGLAKALEATGCNVIDMASSNMNDKGQAAIDASIANYDGHSNILAIAGANRSVEEQNKIRYFTVEGVKFAYLSYTTKSNVTNGTPFGVNMYTDSLATTQITEARKNAQLVIVSMHWGTEYNQDVDVNQNAIAQHLAELNVDIVLGNGPRVIEPVKVLAGTNNHQTIVWFSLGNFLSSQVPVETLIGGMAVMDIDSTTQQLHNPRLLPLYMHYEWTAEQKQRQNEADLLARKNFQIVPLDQAAELLAKSQNGTTVKAQQDRVNGVISKYFKIPLITSADL